MKLKPNWVRIEDMPGEWKDGRTLLGWFGDGDYTDVCWSVEFSEISFTDGGAASPTHVAEVAGPDEKPQP